MIKHFRPGTGVATINSLYKTEHHSTKIFPSDTNLTCTLTALATANAWSAWAEITDGTTKLTSAFATYAGFLTSMVVESLSEIDTIYMLEIAYGDAKTPITSLRFAGTTKFQNPSHQERYRGVVMPAGEKVYYRMKSATAVADTALVHFRYYLLP